MAASTFDRIFGGPLPSNPGPSALRPSTCSPSPEVCRPAGLTSGWLHKAAERGMPTSAFRTHELYIPDQSQRLEASKSCDLNLSSRDIAGASPSRRPIVASSGTGLTTFSSTKRQTNPLVPLYEWGGGGSCSSPKADSTAYFTNRSLDITDIQGTRTRRNFVPTPNPNYVTDKLDIRDISPQRRPLLNRPASTTLCTEGIPRSSSPSRIKPEIRGPGRGTLYNGDIEGGTARMKLPSSGPAFRKGPTIPSRKTCFSQLHRHTAIHNGQVSQFGGGALAHFSGF